MNPARRMLHRLGEALLGLIHSRRVAVGRQLRVISRNVRLSWAFLRSLNWSPGPRQRQPHSSVDTPSMKDELRDLILRGLLTNYISQAGQRGHRYQTVTLGGVQIRGQRSDRWKVLDQIDFAGMKVLDLGSNLGQISLGVRARGASLVDGYEIDPYFLEIAYAITAYEQASRVSFYGRDLASSTSYSEHYDIVLALSVWAFMSGVLEKIAEITDKLLILETHELRDDLVSEYLTPTARWFPYHRILGRTDGGRRAVIAFAKDESAIDANLKVSSTEHGAKRADSLPTPAGSVRG